MQDLVAAPVGEVVSITASHGERELGYLVRFRTSVKELDIELKKLTSRRNDVRRLKEAALRNGEMILDVVTTWLKNVEIVEAKVNKLIGEAALVNSWFKGWLFSRFVLGRRALKKFGVVQGLLAEGNAFGERVSFGRPTEDLPFITDYEAFASRVDVVEKVIRWLKDDAISLVGVYGMPGVGKTMLIPHIVNRVREEKIFGQIVTVKLDQHPEVTYVQKELAKDLGLHFEDDDTLPRRARRLFHRLEQDQNTLVLLDNLWERIDLSEVGIPCRDGHKACKVVFTTRNEDVCSSMDTKKARIEVPVLSEEESWNLFRKRAGDVVDSQNITGIAEELARKCGGLPLAIVTLGRALFGKDQLTWSDARRKLKNLGGLPVVKSCIKMSYDYMRSEEEKMCLLFCSMFSSSYPITEDQLFHYMMGENQIEDVEDLAEARSSLHSIIGRLISACLLLKAENGRIRMHDMVREVAKSIASEEDNGFIIRVQSELRDWANMQLDLCKRLSLMYTTMVSSEPKQIKARSLLTLSFHGNVGLDELPSGFFEEMTCLMTLDLSYTGITALPNSIECLVNLRTLRLEGCDLKIVLLSNNLGRLQILSVRYSNIESLHVSGDELDLKLLDLSSTRLESISRNVISCCPRLEELYALKSLSEFELSEVTFLSHLRTLELHIEDQEFLSRNIPCWEKLERFKLVVGAAESFSSVGIAGDRGQSNSMYLQLSTWSSLANWVIVLLQRTEFLHLDGSNDFGVGWSSDGVFCHLRELIISNYKSLKLNASYDFLVKLTHLEKLVVEDCPVLESLVFISKVPNLKYLRVYRCPMMMFLVRGGLDLLQLEELYIGECLCMKTIIQKDYLRRYNHATRKKETLSKLKVLSLHGLEKLAKLEESSSYVELMNLPELEELRVKECPNLQELPLYDVPKLTKFTADHDWFDKLRWKDQRIRFRLQHLLKHLHLDGHSEFQIQRSSVLDEILSNLRTLTVSNDAIRGYIPYDMLRSLQNIEELKFDECRDLRRLIEFDQYNWRASVVGASVLPSPSPPTSMSKVFPNLRLLSISNCRTEGHLLRVGAVLDLLKLEKLEIKGCSLIEMVLGARVMTSASVGKVFPNLKYIRISNCRKLCYLFPKRVLGDLLKLDSISIRKCSSFEAIFEHETIKAAEEQQSIIDSYGGIGSMQNDTMSNAFSNLKRIHISFCEKLKYLFTKRAACDLLHVDMITIVSCSSMEALIIPGKKAGAGQVSSFYTSAGASASTFTSTSRSSMLPQFRILSGLRSLQVSDCSTLKYLFPLEVIQDMSQLVELHIHKCSGMEMIITGESAEDNHGANTNSIVLQKLKVLSLRKLPKLQYLARPNVQAGFPTLEELMVEDCDGLNKLSLTSIPSLKKFTADPSWFWKLMWDDQDLESHLGSFLNYAHLQGRIGSGDFLPLDQNQHEIFHRTEVLKVSQVYKDKSPSAIPCDFLASFLQLKMLMVKDCIALEVLFEFVGQNEGVDEKMPLVYSSVGASSSSLTRAREVPPSPTFSCLRHITVWGCSKVKYIFPVEVVRGLLQLEELHISDCSSLKMVIFHEEVANDGGNVNKDKAVLPKLKIITLQRLPELSGFVQKNVLFDWSSLVELRLIWCLALRKLPLGFDSVPKLAKLVMHPSKALLDKLEWEDQSIKSHLKDLP